MPYRDSGEVETRIRNCRYLRKIGRKDIIKKTQEHGHWILVSSYDITLAQFVYY